MAKTAKRVRNTTAQEIEAALADQSAIESRKAELAKERQRCLLAGDKDGLDKIRGKITSLQLEEEDTKELITLLQARAADEAAEQAVKSRKDHETRLLSRQVQHRDCLVNIGQIVGDLGKAVRQAEAIGVEIMAGWPWAWQDPGPLLIGAHLQAAISHEFYRTCGQSLPGWKAPSVSDPRKEVIPSLQSKADAAVEYAKRRIAETPSRALVRPTPAPAAEPPRPVQAEAATVPPPTDQVITAAPSNMPRGEHAFSVSFIHDATGEEHVETIVFGPPEFQRCGHDPLGPLGPAGREVAIEIAQARVPEDYVLKAVTFDMQRLIATSED